MIYYIYHIPNFKWKDGSIGKIGCTDELTTRMKRQHASEYEVLETHSDIYIASQREIELQKQYGYPVDNKPYWEVVKMASFNSRSKGGKIGGKTGGSIAGPIGGLKNVQTGHMENIRKLAVELRKRPIVQYDMYGIKIKEWNSAVECASGLNMYAGNITAVCKKHRKSHKGFIFRYKEQTHC
jgi:hypothetical protein